MAPKKEKGGTTTTSSKIWEPSLIAAQFNQVCPEPRKSSDHPATPTPVLKPEPGSPGDAARLAFSSRHHRWPLGKLHLVPLPRPDGFVHKNPKVPPAGSIEGTGKGTPMKVRGGGRLEVLTSHHPFQWSHPEGTPQMYWSLSLWTTHLLFISPEEKILLNHL